MTSISETLAERIDMGPLPLADALALGAQIADRLRQLHDQGAVHGALTPEAIVEAGAELELLPTAEDAPVVTPYTAPEILEGNPADVRSDIFSFGAILYEMLTARSPFQGETPEDLAEAIKSAAPEPTGNPGADRLLNGCLAKSPEDRYPRIQRLQLELKVLMSAARRAAAAPPPVAAPPQAPAVPAAHDSFGLASALNMQVASLENRIGVRLAEQERAIASVGQVANEVLKALRQHQPAPAPQPAAAPPSPTPRSYTRGYSPEPLDTRAVGVERALDLLVERVTRIDMVLSSAIERLQRLEENLDAFDIDAAALRDSVTRDVRNFERSLKAQQTAVESVRTAMSQTDDLVERVVEALDSMQAMIATPTDAQSLAS